MLITETFSKVLLKFYMLFCVCVCFTDLMVWINLLISVSLKTRLPEGYCKCMWPLCPEREREIEIFFFNLKYTFIKTMRFHSITNSQKTRVSNSTNKIFQNASVKSSSSSAVQRTSFNPQMYIKDSIHLIIL